MIKFKIVWEEYKRNRAIFKIIFGKYCFENIFKFWEILKKNPNKIWQTYWKVILFWREIKTILEKLIKALIIFR